MEDASLTPTKSRKLSANNSNLLNEDGKYGGVDENDEDQYSVEAWKTLSEGFREVQSILDRNRALIRQVNENHQSKIPDNMVKNVSLIREINCNIARVTSLYSDLSVDFASRVHQKREINEVKSSDS
ncbi:hypothetical protein LguiB_000706 [Lonicera macranthoides]